MTMKPDDEQKFRAARAAEQRERDREREPGGAKRPRRDLTGRDALRISMIERTAVVTDGEPESSEQAIDLDTRPRDVDAANRWRAYGMGWRAGARGTAPDPKATGHADRGIAEAYDAGYLAGCRARGAAAAEASEMYGYEPSVLRAGGAAAEPDQVVTETEVATALADGAREREQAERTTRARPRGGRR
jgi:hypothetical protein